MIIYLTSGDAGSLQYSKKRLAWIREKEAKAGADILGANEIKFLKQPDGYLDYNKKNIVDIVDLIREEKPDMIYIPHKKDSHKDHKITHELVTEAVRRASGPWFQECKGKPWDVGKVLCYEVWTPLQRISYVEDITREINQKIKALKEHKSQLKDINYADAVEGLNRYRGVTTGRGDYCECFHVYKTDSLGR